MDASEEINKQRSFVEKINLVANVIGNNSRRSGASYPCSHLCVTN